MTVPTSLVPVPSLDELARDPGKAAGLPREVLTSILVKCGVVQTALLTQLLEARAEVRPTQELAEPDQWLSPEQVASILHIPPYRVYPLAKKWPFAKKVSKKCLRISARGLERWLAVKRG